MTNYPPRSNRTPIWILVILGLFGCSLFGCAILAAILFPVFSQAKQAAMKTNCLRNLKQQAQAMLLYAEQNNGTLPHADSWMDIAQSKGTSPEQLRCPSVSAGGFGYAINDQVAGQNLAKFQDRANVVMIFESSDTSKNAHGDPATGTEIRHPDARGFAYLDGHVRMEKVRE